MEQPRQQRAFGTTTDSPIGYLIRRIAYWPLIALENVGPIRERRAPFMKGSPATGLALFDRTHGLHGGSIEAAIRITLSSLPRLDRPRVLVIGSGQGRDVARWARETSFVVGQDLLDFGPEWSPIRARGAMFARSAIEDLPFLDRSFDVVFSKAVFEHLPRLDRCAEEICRVMVPGGVVWADFGPLWYSYGGAHDGAAAYEHLELTAEELRSQVPSHSEAALYLDNDMFSRLRVHEYRQILERHFAMERWVLGVTSEGLRYKRNNPGHWRELTHRFDETDLLTQAIFFLGRKRPATSSEL